MEIEGKVVQVLNIVSGESKSGRSWKKQDFIVEQSGQYQRKACITLFGDKVDTYKVSEGENVKVEVDVESREFNGKWYTNLTAWKLDKIGYQVIDKTPDYGSGDVQFDNSVEDTAGPTDDLPF